MARAGLGDRGGSCAHHHRCKARARRGGGSLGSGLTAVAPSPSGWCRLTGPRGAPGSRMVRRPSGGATALHWQGRQASGSGSGVCRGSGWPQCHRPSIAGTGGWTNSRAGSLSGGSGSAVAPAPSIEGSGGSRGHGDGTSLGDSNAVVPPPPSVDSVEEANAEHGLNVVVEELPMRISRFEGVRPAEHIFFVELRGLHRGKRAQRTSGAHQAGLLVSALSAKTLRVSSGRFKDVQAAGDARPRLR